MIKTGDIVQVDSGGFWGNDGAILRISDADHKGNCRVLREDWIYLPRPWLLKDQIQVTGHTKDLVKIASSCTPLILLLLRRKYDNVGIIPGGTTPGGN